MAVVELKYMPEFLALRLFLRRLKYDLLGYVSNAQQRMLQMRSHGCLPSTDEVSEKGTAMFTCRYPADNPAVHNLHQQRQPVH